ncbi:MAG TPA: hypothetical protein PLL76_23865, partial [Thermoanaerobaculia bacterium]|nr:hypothetical protein [Thermoanaerobaculia bacterium]
MSDEELHQEHRDRGHRENALGLETTSPQAPCGLSYEHGEDRETDDSERETDLQPRVVSGNPREAELLAEKDVVSGPDPDPGASRSDAQPCLYQLRASPPIRAFDRRDEAPCENGLRGERHAACPRDDRHHREVQGGLSEPEAQKNDDQNRGTRRKRPPSAPGLNRPEEQ